MSYSFPTPKGSVEYRWVAIVPASLIILLLSNSLTAGGMAAFDPSLLEEFGVTRAALKLGDAWQFATVAIAAVATGWLADRIGVRPVLAGGVLALVAGFMLLRSAASLEVYYGARVLMGLGLAGAGLPIVVATISKWFTEQRGMPLGVVLGGVSIGNAIVPLAMTAAIAAVGWRQAAGLTALTIAPLLLLIMFVVREAPVEVIKSDQDQADVIRYATLFKMPQFWLLGVAASISYFVMLGVTSNMILVVQSFGGSVTAGATMAVPLFAAGLISKLVAGFMIDRFGSRPVWIASLALMFAGCALFIPGQIALVPFASLLLGLGWGANYTLIQARVGDLFPTASLGRVLGAITLLDAGGAAAGPFVMAYIADTFDSYQPSFVLMCALLVVAAACWNLLERSRKW